MTSTREHLDDDDLRQWRDDPQRSDRERIVAHLAACDACGSRYAEMVRTAPATAIDPPFGAEAFRARGYAVLNGSSRRRGAFTWRALVPLAAAAALVFAVGAYLLVPRQPETVMRGDQASVELVRPSGVTVAVEDLRFEWRAPEDVTRQSLVVFDLASLDEPVISREDVRSGYVPTTEERRRLEPGVTYRWFVEYRAPGGSTAASPSATFSIR